MKRKYQLIVSLIFVHENSDFVAKKLIIRTEEETYIEAYRTMIYFDEEEARAFLDQFNQTGIQLTSYMDGDKYKFPLTVNYH